MEDNLVLRAVSDLLDKQFFIPHYQRGYRWTEQQVTQLLDDIDSFRPKEIPDKQGKETFYCLQPIVVKELDQKTKLENGLEGIWYEVIDGQQRLTTMYLIIHYINEFWLGRDKNPKFKIVYETRKGSQGFLGQLKVNDDDKTVDINKDYIDYFYMSTAYQTIRSWQLDYDEDKGKRLDTGNYQSKFLTNSKIIWYKVSQQEKGQALFERLNLGKIPLTNAELTKALFLSNESFKELSKEEKRIKQLEIAYLWDVIEHKLNEPDLKFWSFITNKKRDSFETKIELLLNMISGKSDNEKDPLYTFLQFVKKQQEGDLTVVWSEIEQFYYTLQEWFKEKDLYHKIGYLIASKHFGDFKGVDLGELANYSLEKTKDDFHAYVDSLIKESVKVEISEMRYEKNPEAIFNVLLLFNVETCRNSSTIPEFYPFKQHKGNKWSIEHIHARKSDNFKQSKKEPWLKWLDLHLPLLEELNNDSKSIDIQNVIQAVKNYNNDQLTRERFTELFNQINDVFTSDRESMDRESEGISNLALLSQPDNAALSNAVFEAKRKEIINLDIAGSFIPICTRRVFMKYFRQDRINTQFHFWSKEDRSKYFNTIKTMLEPYLPTNHIEKDEDNENE
jgi:hypothetical protein